MANQIKAPINYPIIAGGKIVSGGTVLFGQPNVKPDEDNPATLKAVYLDAGLTQQAENPQGISSDGVFDQADTGILYGSDNTVYSIVIRGANKKELSYIPEYDLNDANAAAAAQESASQAASSESNAIAAKNLTEALYTDFTNRYFGAYSADPSVDDLGNPPSEGSIYFNTMSDVFYIWDGSAWMNYFPSNPNGLMVTATGTTTPRSLADRFGGKVHVKDFGVVGDYDTDDTDAYEAALAYCAVNGKTLDHSGSIIRVTRSIDLPEVKLVGDGSPKISHFPQYGGDKNFLRPGYKNLLSGSAVIFSGTADKTYTTNRSDRYSNLSYAFSFKHFSSLDISGVALILDVDVLDAVGSLTTAANDNSSTADVILLSQGTLGLCNDLTIFGYPNDAGYVVHNQVGGLIDSDYNAINNSLISGGVAIIGHDLPAGAATEGLTGNKFVSTGIYGGDHHNRADGDYTRPALYIDGYMGDNEQSGIRGHMFTACNIRTYANDAIVTGYCNDISFVNTVLEFPTLVGVANADAQGGFVGHAGTKRFRSFGAASTDAAEMGNYLSSITGPFQVLGSGQYDQALFGGGGNFVRVSATSTEARVQFNDNFDTQANGHQIIWNKSIDRLQFKHDSKVIAGWDNNGGLRDTGYGVARGNITVSSGAITIGSYSNYSVVGEGSVADTLDTINGGSYDGQMLMLRTASSSAPITLSTSGNIRFKGDVVLTSGFEVVTLQWNGAQWFLISFEDYDSPLLDFSGNGTPEGSVIAVVGSTYKRLDGGAGTTFYVKESGVGSTGWVAK